ncbi:Protein prenyltransferase alpha subunit repeat-containing protein 1 [Rhizoclosmatium sp. JEL0117]|nr:Protein prenyltransferase alpha subunit repeat-containing protein 1 [Rhizoclosmatium sp. JEL0117]
MAELYSTFSRLLKANPASALIDFGFVPPVASLESQESSYHPFLLIEGNLGVPANAIPPLCRFSHSVFFKLANQFSADHKCLADSDLDELDASSKCLLLMNPEIYTAWNIRKKLLTLQRLNATEEMALIDLVLSKHPKRPAAWSHRAWLLPRLRETSSNINKLLTHELKICDQAAQRHRMNYHAWTHRWKVVRTAPLDFRLSAFKSTRKYISSHISEHSAFAHALAVLESILKDPDFTTPLELFHEQVLESMKLIVSYPGHKSPWCYLQGLFLISGRCGLSTVVVDARVREELGVVHSVGSETVDGSQFSEVDVMDWLEALIQKHTFDVSQKEGVILVPLFQFASWIIQASKRVIESRNGVAENETIWHNQIEIALDFQLYLLLGVDGVDNVKMALKQNVKDAGGWPSFLLAV